MVIPVFDPPMVPNGACQSRRIQTDLTGVVGDVPARRPKAGAGVLDPGQARDAGRTGHQRLPLRTEAVVNVENLGEAMLLAAMAMAVHRFMTADRLLLLTEPGHGIMKTGLVGLHADQQGIAGRGGSREPLFWQCSASAVKSTPLRPSSAMRSGMAGTSSGAPSTSWCARISAASLANALKTCAAVRSCRWSKLPRRVLPSSATVRQPFRPAC